MPMKKPVHPGRIVRRDCLEPLGLSVTGAAKVLGVTRQALNNVVNQKAGISPEMAIRLSKAFGSTPDTWVPGNPPASTTRRPRARRPACRHSLRAPCE